MLGLICLDGSHGGSLNRLRSAHAGFSLVEIAVVLVIVGLLATLSLPSYRESVRAANRAEAKSELLRVAIEQERYFSRFTSYLNDASPLTLPATPGRAKVTTSGAYSLAVTACPGGTLATCFVATATPLGTQALDACTSLTLNSLGVRAATGTLANLGECWAR